MAEEDIISTLPDEILCHILSFLQTKEADATTILSKRWKHLSRLVPNLFIDVRIENQYSNTDFTNFVNSILFSRAAFPIKNFHLRYDYPLQSSDKKLTDWVNFVVQRGVECLHLDVNSSGDEVKLPITIFTCKTLVVLNLSFFRVEHCCFSSVLLPSLKTFHLEYVRFPKLRDFLLLLTGCPNLEDLYTYDVDFDSDSMESLTCNEWKNFLLRNLTRATIDCYNDYFPVKAVYNVQFLHFDYNQQEYYRDDLIPTFHNLTQLELTCYYYSKDFLLDVLNRCPKLQRLDLQEVSPDKEVCARIYDKTNSVFPNAVPQCLLLHLRTCNLYSFLGLHGGLMLASYILKNAEVLQTMEIWNIGKQKRKQKSAIKRILFEVPMASSICKLRVYNNS